MNWKRLATAESNISNLDEQVGKNSSVRQTTEMRTSRKWKPGEGRLRNTHMRETGSKRRQKEEMDERNEGIIEKKGLSPQIESPH